jgi:hypothetical protein
MSMPSTEQQFVPIPQRRKDVAKGSDDTPHEIILALHYDAETIFCSLVAVRILGIFS